MGKQRNKQKISEPRPESVNAINWQGRAFQLYEAGLISREALGLDPDYRPTPNPTEGSKMTETSSQKKDPLDMQGSR